ncbi:MAG: Ig-like domain-containing protein [Mycobacterium sp.]
MGYAPHVGRVGALAVALGIGAGVIWAPGVAFAEPTDSSGTTSSDAGPAQSGTPSADKPDAPSPADDAENGPDSSGDGANIPAPGDDREDEAEAPSEALTESPPAVRSTHSTSRVTKKKAAAAANIAPPAGSAHAVTSSAEPQEPQEARQATSARTEAVLDIPTIPEPKPLRINTIESTSAPVLHPISVVLATPIRIVNAVVGALLTPFLGLAGSGTPAPPTRGAMLAWARQELHRTFFNRAPRLAAAPIDVEQVDDVVTGTIVGTDPDGDAIKYSVTPSTTEGGTVTIDGAGTFTYVAPTSWNGTDALTDSFTVSAVDKGFHIHGLLGLFGRGHSATRVVTVQLAAGVTEVAEVTETIPVAVPQGWTNPRTRVGPRGTVAITQQFGSGTLQDPFSTQILVEAPGRPPVTATAAGIVYGGGPLIADDGTVHLTTVVYNPANFTITEFTVTTLQPGKTPVQWTVPGGTPVGGPMLTAAGDFMLTAATGGGAPEDTQTTVTIIRDGERREVLRIAGATQDQATVGADGTIALTATNASGGTTIGVLRPGADAEYLELSGTPQGPVTVADDGTLIFTTAGAAGFTARAVSTTTLWVWRAGGQAVPITIVGTMQQVVTGAGGTVAYVTTTGSGTVDDLVTTTVTVLRPGLPDQVSTVTGTLVASVVAGADGTVAFHTHTGPDYAFFSDMTVTIMRRGGTVETMTKTSNASYRVSPAVGPDGTVASMWGNDGMTIAVFRPGQSPIVVTYPGGVSIAPTIGSDGTVAFIVGESAPTGEQYSQIVVMRPGKATSTAGTIGAGWGGLTVTGDGTVVATTRVDRNLSCITVLRADGTYLIVPAPGLVSNPAQVGPDGVIYLPTDVDGTSVNLTIVNTANRFVTVNLPGRASGFSINANGGGTDFVTVSLDASGSLRYIINRVFVATTGARSAATLVTV